MMSLKKKIEKNSGFDQDLALARIENKEFVDRVADLQDQLDKAKSAAFMGSPEGDQDSK